MKCKELMVGDFCRSGHGFPMQITNVGDDYAYATFEGNEGEPWEFDDKDEQPRPIEITKELLEANGWVIDNYYSVKHNRNMDYYVREEGSYNILWDNGTLSLFHNDNSYYYDAVIPCKYVHQIQQVLRIAGMTELANNFKIQLYETETLHKK